MSGVRGLNIQPPPLPVHGHRDGASGGDLEAYVRQDRASAQSIAGALNVIGYSTFDGVTIGDVLTLPDLNSTPVQFVSNSFINLIGAEAPSAGYRQELPNWGTESGSRICVSACVNETNQSSAVAQTSMGAAAVAGLFLVGGLIEVTTGDATAGSLQAKIVHTDSVGAVTETLGGAALLTATGRTSLGPQLAYCASGRLDYKVDVTGAVNAARYNFRVFAVRVT